MHIAKSLNPLFHGTFSRFLLQHAFEKPVGKVIFPLGSKVFCMGKILFPVGQALFPPRGNNFPLGRKAIPLGETVFTKGRMIFPGGKTIIPKGKGAIPLGKMIIPAGEIKKWGAICVLRELKKTKPVNLVPVPGFVVHQSTGGVFFRGLSVLRILRISITRLLSLPSNPASSSTVAEASV